MMTVTKKMDARDYLAELLQDKYGFPKKQSFTFAYEINDAAVKFILVSHDVSVTEEARRHAR